jgi:single-strand DNA-binding protein
MNNCNFIGRVTDRPELRFTNSGKGVSTFTLAVERKFKDQQGNKQTDFVSCVAWGKQSELLAEYVGKGERLAITGELQSRKYENKEGRNVTVWEVNVGSFYLIGGKSEGKQSGSDINPFEGAGKPLDISDDDLPF